MNSRTLTKTRFALALECPTKVFYSLDKRYADTKLDDEFLEALANGGHQIGALAKLMFRAVDNDAVEITAVDQDAQVAETTALLGRANVTIFEATVRHENLLVRIDVLSKRGSDIDLIEVKAKSWEPEADSLVGLTKRANPLSPEWEPYIYDVAFQERVLTQAFPAFTVHPWLMLVDKSRINSIRGLASAFEIVGEGRRRSVRVDPAFDIKALCEPLLIRVDAREAVRRAQTLTRVKKGRPDIVFGSLIDVCANAITREERLGPYPGTPCKACEFYVAPGDANDDNRSGWASCMEVFYRRPVEASREETIFGFYGQSDITGHLDAKHLLIRDLDEADLPVRESPGKISATERHRLQWREMRFGELSPVIELDAVRATMAGWRFPLHFIDFETAQPALPFHAGQRPYQHILFQFSHHVVLESGEVRHATECLLIDGDESPSIAVVRQLREALTRDTGTILHWYPHERTVLAKVRAEIESSAPPDSAQLLEFLGTLGLEKDSNLRLFDLGRLVADQVFLAGTGGSSSMKRFLPAVLRHSTMIRALYSKPIYGTPALPSRNFANQAWVVERDGSTMDPYKLLDPLFRDADLDIALENLEAREGAVVANGAAAMIAYATLQDANVPRPERERLKGQLLRYCELDTFAMVMVYQALRDWVHQQ